MIWSWDFGDGNTSYLQNPTHKYHSNGFYTVNLKVEDNLGGFDNVSKLIIVDIEVIEITNLYEGWNFISTPYNQSLDAYEFLIEYDGYYYNWTMAVSDINPTDALLFYHFLYGWDRTNQSYDSTFSLDPGEGCWIYANVDC